MPSLFKRTNSRRISVVQLERQQKIIQTHTHTHTHSKHYTNKHQQTKTKSNTNEKKIIFCFHFVTTQGLSMDSVRIAVSDTIASKSPHLIRLEIHKGLFVYL